MSDMRLVVAGAGGRMGRTLIKAIAETKGLTLAGALEEPGSPLIGRDAGELAGLPPTGIAVTADASALAGRADGVIDFTVPARPRQPSGGHGKGRSRAHHRHDRPVGRGRSEDRPPARR